MFAIICVEIYSLHHNHNLEFHLLQSTRDVRTREECFMESRKSWRWTLSICYACQEINWI